MTVINAEYEEQGKEGIIRLWPAPVTVAEGKRLAAEVLESAKSDRVLDLEQEVNSLEEQVDELQDERADLRMNLRDAEAKLRRFCESKDPAEFTKDNLVKLLDKVF